MTKGTRTCGDQVDLPDTQVGVHRASNPGFHLKITFFTVAKHCQEYFAKHPGNKVAQVERLWGSVNLAVNEGNITGAYPVIGFFPFIYFLGTNYWPPLWIKYRRTRAFGVPQNTQNTNKCNVHTGWSWRQKEMRILLFYGFSLWREEKWNYLYEGNEEGSSQHSKTTMSDYLKSIAALETPSKPFVRKCLNIGNCCKLISPVAARIFQTHLTVLQL